MPSQSRTFVQGCDHSNSSACCAQNPSGSFSARSRAPFQSRCRTLRETMEGEAYSWSMLRRLEIFSGLEMDSALIETSCGAVGYGKMRKIVILTKFAGSDWNHIEECSCATERVFLRKWR